MRQQPRSAVMGRRDVDKSTLDRLEERTRQAVEALQALRRDNKKLQSDLESAGQAGDGGSAELQLLREEREAVRARVEGLVRVLEEARRGSANRAVIAAIFSQNSSVAPGCRRTFNALYGTIQYHIIWCHRDLKDERHMAEALDAVKPAAGYGEPRARPARAG